MNNQRTSTELTKAFLIYTPPQNEVFYRPYISYVDDQLANEALAVTEGGRLINRNTLAGIASNIIMPSYNPCVMVPIANGLSNTGRFSVKLEITTNGIFGTEREIIDGFTDYDGINFNSGAIDPNMVIHFNSRMLIRQSPTVGVNGNTEVSALRDMQNILAYNELVPNAIALRPQDAVYCQQGSIMRKPDNGYFDTRSLLSGATKVANMAHNNPASYLSDICNGYMLGANPKEEHYISAGETTIYDRTLEHVRGGSIELSRFWGALARVQPYPKSTQSCTFAELDIVWPRRNDFWIKIMPSGNGFISPMDYTEHWGGAIMETSVAYSLTHIMPVIMSKLMLMKLVVSISNMHPGNEIVIQPLGWSEMFEGTVDQPTLNYLISQIQIDVVHGLLLNKASVFNVLMDINLLTNSKIEISLNAGPMIPYHAPMFCSSYYSPLVSPDNNSIMEIAGHMEALTERISEFTSTPFYMNHAQPVDPLIDFSTPHPINRGNTGFSNFDNYIY